MQINDFPAGDRSVITTALQAMSLNLCLALTYRGEPRVVEVHAVGLSIKGKPCMRVYQVTGGTNTSEPNGWKLMSMANVEDAKLLNTASMAPRPGYSPGDKGMSAIFAEIFNDPVPPEG